MRWLAPSSDLLTVSGSAGVVLLAVLISACGRNEATSGDSDRSNAGIGERHVVVESWDTLWALGGPQDSLLLRPFILSAQGDDRLFVYDGGGRRVIALDARNGRVEWTFGKEGAGPDELRGVRDLKADGRGGVYALDPRNNRITHLDSTGRVARRIPLTSVGHAEQFVPLSDGRVVLFTLSDSAFTLIDAEGTVQGKFSLPWEGYADLPSLARQGYIAADGDEWVFGFSIGDGWFPFRRDEPGRIARHYVERTEFPEVRQVQTAQGVMNSMAEYNACSGCSLSLAGGNLYVHFGGYRDAVQAVVDRYEYATGRYTGSLRLPVTAKVVASTEERLYLLFEEPYPALLALAPRGEAVRGADGF